MGFDWNPIHHLQHAGEAVGHAVAEPIGHAAHALVDHNPVVHAAMVPLAFANNHIGGPVTSFALTHFDQALNKMGAHQTFGHSAENILHDENSVDNNDSVLDAALLVAPSMPVPGSKAVGRMAGKAVGRVAARVGARTSAEVTAQAAERASTQTLKEGVQSATRVPTQAFNHAVPDIARPAGKLAAKMATKSGGKLAVGAEKVGEAATVETKVAAAATKSSNAATVAQLTEDGMHAAVVAQVPKMEKAVESAVTLATRVGVGTMAVSAIGTAATDYELRMSEHPQLALDSEIGPADNPAEDRQGPYTTPFATTELNSAEVHNQDTLPRMVGTLYTAYPVLTQVVVIGGGIYLLYRLVM